MKLTRFEEYTASSEDIGEIRQKNAAFQNRSGRAPCAFVLTFGCQQNEADSEKLMGMALDMGYEKTENPEEAELILVNTCAIREHAEQKALSIIGQYKHLKAQNPELVIGVCGCMVSQEHRVNDIKFRYPYVDFVIATSSLHRLPILLAEKFRRGKRLYDVYEPENHVVEGIPVHRENSYRAWVSIMYGCNNFCSYCIVPYVRGRERSRASESIYAEVKELIEGGCKDITLLGQNVNSYGKDIPGGKDFADLLRRLSEIKGDYRLHFMTSHPKDATSKLIDVMAECEHIAPHFHLPVQSGSDDVLFRMNRHYDREHYLSIVDYMRARIPNVTLTTDIIVGFPGESEEDFEATLDIMRRVRYDSIYSFIYSPRKGTPAAEMADQIPRAVQNARFDRLLKLQNEIASEKNRPLVGERLRVLCDGPSKTNEALYSGRTDGGKIVFFEATPDEIGQFISVKIDRAEAFALYGSKEK